MFKRLMRRYRRWYRCKYHKRFSMKQKAVHMTVFAGLLSSAGLQRYGLHDWSIIVALVANGLWIFHRQ